MFKKENNNITRHSELVSESIKNKALHSTGLFADAHPSYLGTAYGVACRHRIESGMTKYGHEQGRSMVEMLGVLAVIGILSVAGVKGYTNAMNKHRANELLNEASKRAVVLAMKLSAGQALGNNPLSEFGTNTVSGATFGTVGTQDNTFTIDLSGAAEICDQLKTLDDGSIMAFNEDCTQITFNKDLSRGVRPYEGANGGNDTSNTGNDTPACTGDEDKCEGGTYYVCENGSWVSQTLPAGKVCNGDELALSADPCNDGAGICLNGTYYYCCGGGWQTGYYGGCCDGNTPIAEGAGKCENSTYYICSGGEWNRYSDYDINCDGNTYSLNCTSGAQKCVNGTYYYCNVDGASWSVDGPC